MLDSVTAQVIKDGFEVMERCLVALKVEVRAQGTRNFTPLTATDTAFEAMRSFMHDGPDVDDA
jgi:hypothetical protein